MIDFDYAKWSKSLKEGVMNLPSSTAVIELNHRFDIQFERFGCMGYHDSSIIWVVSRGRHFCVYSARVRLVIINWSLTLAFVPLKNSKSCRGTRHDYFERSKKIYAECFVYWFLGNDPLPNKKESEPMAWGSCGLRSRAWVGYHRWNIFRSTLYAHLHVYSYRNILESQLTSRDCLGAVFAHLDHLSARGPVKSAKK